MKYLPLTTPACGSNFNPPFEEAHQPDGRPAGRQRRATEKRTSAQVVLSTSPRPDSVIAGRTTDKGDSRGRTRSLEIDARQCKSQHATDWNELRFRKVERSERASAQEDRKIGKGFNRRLRPRLRLRKEGRSEGVLSQALAQVKTQEGRKIGKGFTAGFGPRLRLRKEGRSERASAREDWKTGKGFGSGRLENRKGLRPRKIKRLEEASATDNRRTGKCKLEGSAGGKDASPGSRRENRREPVEPEG